MVPRNTQNNKGGVFIDKSIISCKNIQSKVCCASELFGRLGVENFRGLGNMSFQSSGFSNDHVIMITIFHSVRADIKQQL